MLSLLKRGACVAVMCVAAPAVADTTAEEFLQEFMDLYAASGMEITHGATSKNGDTLTVQDLSMTFDGPEFSMEVPMGEILIRELDDPDFDIEYIVPGTVSVSPEITVEGVNLPLLLEFTLDGVTRVGGPADARVWQIDYSDVNIKYALSSGDTEDMPALDFTVNLADSNGELIVNSSEETMEYDFGFASMSYTMKIEEPGGSDGGDIVGNYADVRMVGSGPIVDGTDPEAMFATDGITSFTLTTGAADGSGEITSDGTTVDVSGSATSSSLNASFGRGQIEYGYGGEGLKVSVAGSALPLPPVDVEMAAMDVRFAMPIAARDELGEMAIRVNLEDVSVSEMLWGMIDPTGQLPHDPATILIDVSSAARALMDFMNPEAATQFAGGMPFEFEDVSLNELRVSIAGAELTGDGKADINNDGPFPMPAGAVDLQIVGVQGLIGKLMEMGLLQPEQAMPAQMMLGMFAKPGDEADVFTSRIEATADGSITANGVPLQ